MRNKFKKIAPSRKKIESNKLLRPIAHLLGDGQIWHFNRRNVAKGVAIGVLVGFLPIPFQMLLAAILAIFSRVNMPTAIIFTWITNPITMPFLFTINYYTGCLILGVNSHIPHLEFSFKVLSELGSDFIKPLFLGSIVLGAIFALLSYLAVMAWWRYSVIQQHTGRRKNKAL